MRVYLCIRHTNMSVYTFTPTHLLADIQLPAGARYVQAPPATDAPLHASAVSKIVHAKLSIVVPESKSNQHHKHRK